MAKKAKKAKKAARTSPERSWPFSDCEPGRTCPLFLVHQPVQPFGRRRSPLRGRQSHCSIQARAHLDNIPPAESVHAPSLPAPLTQDSVAPRRGGATATARMNQLAAAVTLRWPTGPACPRRTAFVDLVADRRSRFTSQRGEVVDGALRDKVGEQPCPVAVEDAARTADEVATAAASSTASSAQNSPTLELQDVGLRRPQRGNHVVDRLSAASALGGARRRLRRRSAPRAAAPGAPTRTAQSDQDSARVRRGAAAGPSTCAARRAARLAGVAAFLHQGLVGLDRRAPQQAAAASAR